MSEPEPYTVEEVEETDTSGLLDAPNQQVVRPDASGPADEGEGGTEASVEPTTDAEREVREAEPESEPEPETNPLDEMTKGELIDEAERRGVDVDASATKAEIREALG